MGTSRLTGVMTAGMVSAKSSYMVDVEETKTALSLGRSVKINVVKYRVS